MTQQTINTGSGANTGTGDTLPVIVQKANANFGELYGALKLSINAQTGTAYTIAATDMPAPNYSGALTMNNAAANTVTVPAYATTPFPVGAQLQITQLGAGQTAVAAAAGVTIHTASSFTARVQYSTIVLTCIAQDVWVVGGNLT